jgi:LysM repeat protein
VTNYVTNWAAVPQFDKRGTSRLTQPAQQVPSPSDQQEIADRRAPDVPKPAETSAHAARPKPSSNSRNAPQHGAPALTANGRSPASNTASLMNSSKPQSVHTVRPGETLAALADNYGISLKELKAANPAAANGVRAGQKIIIPGK